MAKLPNHFCPGCGETLKPFPRYPWYFCRSCVDKATDGDGRPIAVSGGMGFFWRYADEDEAAWRSCIAVLAQIAGRPVHITEARFGGVVAEPMDNRLGSPDRHGVTDLSRPTRR